MVEAWLDAFEPGTVWVTDATKQLLDGAGPPLAPSAVVESAGIPIFYLMKMGGSANHAWRLFRTRDEAVEFMARQFPGDAKARAWADALPVARYSDLLSRESK